MKSKIARSIAMLLYMAPLLAETSISDTPSYTDFCAIAAREATLFSTFKQNPAYQDILEHVRYEQGQKYLDLFLEQSPEWLSHLEEFRENDRLGSPTTYSYGAYGIFSPTTLRYMKVASDLYQRFGSLDNLDIIEIGAGYGGQCKILSCCFAWKSYTIVDLPPVLDLIRVYLTAHGIENVTLLTREELPWDKTYDLLISNFAFTECHIPVQYDYLGKAVYPSLRGYMLCCEYPDPSLGLYGKTIPKKQLIRLLKSRGLNCTVESETPPDPYWPTNYLLTWERS